MDSYDDKSSQEPLTGFSISCYDVPDSLFDQDAAIEHFGKFGTVTQILLQPKKYSCIIHYNTRDAADKALLNAGAYDGFMFDVKLNKKKRQAKNDDPEWLPDAEVAAELAAMSRNNPPMQRLNRVQKMDVGDTSPILSKKAPHKKSVSKTIERKKIKPAPKLSSKQNELQLVTKINEEELTQLVTRQWISVDDKLNALDIRNRILRSHLQRRHGALKGCCPDMCPERERLLRQTQRRVAIYEIDGQTNQMDPKCALKEYSRSSADQEEPLPHELRPEPVLHQSLLYLLHYIAELSNDPETSLADWFHFMWDRLRAIRKDITQQALCCKGSVALVEACARFHAHCAARLIEEPPSSFDQRLNTENLSKCLQSLKYMYNDLRARGESDACVNEPEFRAYVILLNMHDSNFMWEVQQLPPEVQSSPEVCFAINLFTVLDNNNYIKFFKLVKQTTYLNACILLRYFNEVRLRAIQRMIKAYSPRGISPFPAKELMDMLAFENIECMEYFLDHHGLELKYDDASARYDDTRSVILNKNNFANHNVALQMQERAIQIIESKIQVSLGEMIYGSELPKYDSTYTPHSSFDENHYINKNAILGQDQGNLPPLEIVQEVYRIIEKPVPERKSFDTLQNAKLNNEKKFVFAEPTKPRDFSQLNTNQSPFNTATSKLSSSNLKNENVLKVNPFKNESSETSFTFSKPVAPIMSNQFSIGTIFERPANVASDVIKSDVKKDPTNIFSSVQFGNVGSKPFESNVKNIFGGNSASDFKDNYAFKNNVFGQYSVPVVKNTSPLKNNYEEEARLKLEEENKRKEQEKKRIEIEQKKQEEIRKQELEKAIEIEKKIELARQEAEKEREQKEKEKVEYEESVDNYLDDAIPEIIDEVIEDMCQSIIIDESSKIDDIREEAKSIYTELVIEVCDEEINDGIRIANKLNNIRDCAISRRVVKQWKSVVYKSQRRRSLLNSTPAWLSTSGPPSMMPNQTDALQRMRDFHQGKSYYFKMPEELKIRKINVFDEVKKYLYRKSQETDRISFSSNIFWKITISLPCKNESEKNSFANWVDAALSNEVILKNENNIIYLTEEYWHKKFNISLSKVTELIARENIENNKALLGANGYIFYGDIDKSKSVIERLDNIILSKCELDPLPVAIILHLSSKNLPAAQKIKERLYEFKNKNFISAFKISTVPDLSDDAMSYKTLDCLKWLSKYRATEPQIEINHLTSFLDKCIGRELWYRFKLALKSPIRHVFQDVHLVNEVYNEAVNRTLQMACGNDILEYPTFPEEFREHLSNNSIYPKDYKYIPLNWKDNIHNLEDIIGSFKVIKYSDKWPPTNWEAFQSSIKSFITNLKWYKDVESVFLKVLSIFVLDDIFNENFISESHFDENSWLSIMEVLVSEKINGIQNDMDSSKVVYRKNDLDAYRTIPWWYRLPQIQSTVPYIEKVDLNFLDDTLDDLGIRCPKSCKLDLTMDSIPDDEWMTSVMIDLDTSVSQKMISDLEKTIDSESARQAELEEYLKKIIGE